MTEMSCGIRAGREFTKVKERRFIKNNWRIQK